MANPSLDSLYSAWSAKKDVDALNDLILAVRDRAKLYFRQFGPDADDLAQDVAILILGKLPDYKPCSGTRFDHWFNAIVKRTKQDAWGAVKHISSTDVLEEADEEAHRYISLAGLPPEIAEVAQSLLLGYSIEETAARMNMKPGTLRKRLHAYRNR